MTTRTRREIVAGGGVAALGAAVAAVALTGPAVAAGTPGYPVFDASPHLISQIVEWICDCEMDHGSPDKVCLTRAAYKQATLGNNIDWIPDADGNTTVPALFGHRVSVPGTRLA